MFKLKAKTWEIERGILRWGRTFLSPEPLSADSAFTPQREPTCAPHCAPWGSRWPGRSSPGNKPALWRAAGQRWPGTGQTGPEDQTGTFWGRQLGEDQVSTPGGASRKSGCRRQGRISEQAPRALHCPGGGGQGRGCEREGDRGASRTPSARRPAWRPRAGHPGGTSWLTSALRGEEMIPKAWLLLGKYYKGCLSKSLQMIPSVTQKH